MRTTTLCGLALILLAASQNTAWGQTNNYFGTSGSLDGHSWSTNPSGPYTSLLATSNGAVLNFDNAATFAGGSVQVRGINATANATLSTSSGSITNYANGIVPINVAQGVTLDFKNQSFATASSAGYSKIGEGVLALSGSAFGGGFTLSQGTVIARGANTMGTGGTLRLNGGILASDADRDFTGKYAGGISIGGNVQFGDTVGLASSTANLKFSDSVSLGSANRILTIGNGGIVSILGVIENSGTGGITFSATPAGTGRFEITNNSNTFAGPVSILGGEARFSANGSLGVSTNSIVIDGGRLSLVSGTGFQTLSSSRALSLGDSAGTSLSIEGASSISYGGVISDVSNKVGSWSKQGSGTLALGGVSTYSGTTTINAGTLQLTSGNNRLPTGTTLSMGQTAASNLGTLDLNGFSQQLAGLNSLSGTNSTTANNTVTSVSAATLTLGGTGHYVFGSATNGNSGVITGSISLVKSGSGTQVLGDSNTYSGQTRVNAGTLAVNGSLSNSSASVLVNSGGTLGGTGTVNRPVTVNPGGTIRGDSGTGTGTLALGNATKLVGATNGEGATLASYLTVVDGTIVANSKLSTGTNALNFDVATGKFNILLLNDAGLTAGQSYTITLANGSNFRQNDVGATSFSALDFTLASGSGSWEFLSTSLSVSSSKLELTFVPTTPVPEPATTLALGALGLTAAFGARRCMPRGAEVAEVRVVPDGRAVPAGGFLSPTAASCRTHAIVVS